LSYDEEMVALRLLPDRRDELSHLPVQTVNRLHRLRAELIPGGAKRDMSALQAKRLPATVKPRTADSATYATRARFLVVPHVYELIDAFPRGIRNTAAGQRDESEPGLDLAVPWRLSSQQHAGPGGWTRNR